MSTCQVVNQLIIKWNNHNFRSPNEGFRICTIYLFRFYRPSVILNFTLQVFLSFRTLNVSSDAHVWKSVRWRHCSSYLTSDFFIDPPPGSSYRTSLTQFILSLQHDFTTLCTRYTYRVTCSKLDRSSDRLTLAYCSHPMFGYRWYVHFYFSGPLFTIMVPPLALRSVLTGFDLVCVSV